MAVYQSQIEALRRRQIERIRRFCIASGWSPHGYARRAAVSEALVRDMLRSTWRPSEATLAKLEGLIPLDFMADAAVVDTSPALHEGTGAAASEASDALREAPVVMDLPTGRLDRGIGPFAQALAIWQQSGGVATPDFLEAIARLGIQQYGSLVFIGTDGRLRFEWQGGSVVLWRPEYVRRIRGKLVVDQPDRSFARFAEAGLWRTHASDQPQFQAKRVWVDTRSGTRMLSYRSLQLPLRSAGKDDPVRVLSVALTREQEDAAREVA